MQFYPTNTDPTSSALLVCRNVRWNIVVMLVVFWAIPLGLWFAGAPKWLFYAATILPLLLTWPLISSWRKRGRADNWVIVLHGDGIWLNLRDCEYVEAEAGNTIVYLLYREIASGRRIVHRYTTPSSDHGSTSHKDVYLELRLKSHDCDKLIKALAEERRRDPPKRAHLGGVVTSQTRRTQFPIEMEGETALRVKFAVGSYGLRPSIKKVLATLGGFIVIEEEHRQISENWRDLDDNAFDDLVRCLARAGKRLDAERLLRERKGLSTTAAHQFIEALEGGEQSPVVS